MRLWLLGLVLNIFFRRILQRGHHPCLGAWSVGRPEQITSLQDVPRPWSWMVSLWGLPRWICIPQVPLWTCNPCCPTQQSISTSGLGACQVHRLGLSQCRRMDPCCVFVPPPLWQNSEAGECDRATLAGAGTSSLGLGALQWSCSISPSHSKAFKCGSNTLLMGCVVSYKQVYHAQCWPQHAHRQSCMLEQPATDLEVELVVSSMKLLWQLFQRTNHPPPSSVLLVSLLSLPSPPEICCIPVTLMFAIGANSNPCGDCLGKPYMRRTHTCACTKLCLHVGCWRARGCLVRKVVQNPKMFCVWGVPHRLPGAMKQKTYLHSKLVFFFIARHHWLLIACFIY